LTVASQDGEGSTFSFSLPLQRSAALPVDAIDQAAATLEPGAEALRILLADDNPTNQLIIEALLEPMGVELTTVSDGRQAVAAFAPGRFDLVLMDVQMPEMNGVEATIEIRKRERTAKAAPTPIIALTANVMRHQIEAYLNAGMGNVIAKPIEASVLFQAIEAALTPLDAADAA
ncbi:MAG: response regulator, partial [Caulobacteraceae bacterium]